MLNWNDQNTVTLVASIIGVFGALLGVIVLSIIENRRRRKELIEKSKPIIINIPYNAITDYAHIPYIVFVGVGTQVPHKTSCYFKNTNNGIAFFDYIETKNKKYIAQHNAAVDKDSVFGVELYLVEGESLTEFKLFCHDIFGNKYKYDVEFDYEDNKGHIYVSSIQPVRCGKLKTVI